MLKKIGLLNITALIFFFLISCFITFPLIFHLTDFATGLGDELLIAWNHNWIIYSLLHGIPGIINIFNANIYYPFSNTLAYSDFYFTNGIIALIPVLILKSPIVANNVNIIVSLTLVGFITFKLSQQLTKNNLVSLPSGILIVFSPAFLAYLVHIQIISIYFIPLSILFYVKFLLSGRTKFYFLFLSSFVLQAYNSFMPAYFIVFAIISISIFYFLKNKNLKSLILSKEIIISSLIGLFLIIIIAVPYYKVSREFNYVRDLRDTIHFALQPEDFISTDDYSRLNPILSKIPFTKDLQGKGEVKPGFLGISFMLLFVLAFLFIIKNWKRQDFVVKGIFAASLLGLVLSLGPFLHIQRFTIHYPFPIPLPYLPFYYLLPGFEGFRNSARFEIMFLVFTAPIIAVYLAHVFRSSHNFKKLIIVFIFSAIAILEFNFPIKFYQVPQINHFPKVYSYLAQTPKSTVVIHMPVYNWNLDPIPHTEVFREYYSTLNFRKTVNGASGFSPPPWQSLVNNLLANFPSNDSILKLKSLGVNLIIVHKKEYDVLYKENFDILNKKTRNGSEIINSLFNNKNVSFFEKLEDDYVFNIK